ncbi:MAG: hypothetical protein PHH49_06820 [Candidatus Omnitrophica bacterium]|nr:hypothetical protein [Candidatus Omnitrophota bacterium]MDD5488651.1 hypothetical protein [Candidatus Omnitrophota bacterium]
MAKAKVLKKIPVSSVNIFKIRNRQGYAAICKENLTEGKGRQQVLERMNKALKRMGYTLA